MERWQVDDVELTYEVREGDVREGGEPIVFVHAAPFVAWYRPLVEELPDFSTLVYRRRLINPERGPYRPLTVAEDAALCSRLIDRVGWRSAHVVGHSYGALVALELAADLPDFAATIALLEPAARGVSSSANVAAALQPVVAAYQSGDRAGAVDAFLTHVCGDDYRAALERRLPGAFDDALAEADLFFQAELPAVANWAFGPERAQEIEQPVLNVLGAASVQRFVEASELVQSWLPAAERLLVPDAGHLLMVQNPSAIAEGLSDFVRRHPIGTDRSAARSPTTSGR